VRRSRNRARKKCESRWRPSRADLERLVEEAIVDAYNESEQRCGLFTVIAFTAFGRSTAGR